MQPYLVHIPNEIQAPLVVSIPHCGTLFPAQVSKQLKDEFQENPEDTDWFVDQLYEFVLPFGIPVIKAVYNRWVVDLNRDPSDVPLYTDSRIITGVCPVTNFRGEFLYKDERKHIDEGERSERIEKYFKPYHLALGGLVEEVKNKFGKVLIWDCHSIRQRVQSIYEKEFPDLILGDNDGFSAGVFLREIASKSLAGGGYSFENNFLFKGGYITRHYGRPDIHQHALQLEMTKVNYMDDEERTYDTERAEKMQLLLRRTFEKLITVLLV